MKKWRIIAEGTANLRHKPWSGAIGIEEIDDDLAVPSIVCWMSRGWGRSVAEHIVKLHNSSVDEDAMTWDDGEGFN